ncbi:response regulator [Croceicoccus ponticola]|uniref:Response regulator n=1 Tax=Croceicoccus ponticola TaxID=2217664 RepID=A0A437GXZ9_9SPHN|nr:response regulator [Croceicoccus ponticola]RVQ67526.1 response regulator [Croceicoccus ponticola]
MAGNSNWPVGNRVKQRRLLVVDDEREIGALIKRVGEGVGYEVALAQNSDDFQQEFELAEPDAIVLDLAIPDGDGIELLRYLTEKGCEAEILLISGFDQRVLNTAFRLGTQLGLKMSGTIEKPMRVVDLRAALARIGNDGE